MAGYRGSDYRACATRFPREWSRLYSTVRIELISTTRLRTTSSGRVFMPQMICQLRLLGIVAETQQRLCLGTDTCWLTVSRVYSVQVNVDLTEERMKPVIHRTHWIGSIEVGSVSSCHHRIDEIQVIASVSVLYRSSRPERGHRLILHRATVNSADLSRRYGEENELALSPSHDSLCTNGVIKHIWFLTSNISGS